MLPYFKSRIAPFVKKTGCNAILYFMFGRHIKEACTMASNEAQAILDKIYPAPKGSCFANNLIAPDGVTDLTIIIPVYNAENYIEECISSVLNQNTKYRYVIKVINDGSTDRTGSILKRFEANPLITVIGKQNGGAADARNLALKEISSKYVMFVDGDDVLYPNAVEALLDAAYRYDTQIIQGGYERFSGDRLLSTVKGKLSGDEKDKHKVSGLPCAKVYESSIFQNVQFPIGFWFEDTIVIFLLACKARKISLIDTVIYRWRVHSHSMSCKTQEGNVKLLDTFYVFRLILDELNRYDIKPDHSTYEKSLRQAVINGKRLFALPEQVRQAAFVLLSEVIQTKLPACHTKQGFMYREMEKALRNKEFKRYEALCKWM